MATESTRVHVVGFGESMIRFAPSSAADDGTGKPSHRATFLRSVGGDELNVTVAATRLGHTAEWVSVLPVGPHGDVIRSCARVADVDISHIIDDDRHEAELGIFTVIPELSCVSYQRSNSSFAALADASKFAWSEVFAPRGSSVWYHCTGITPLCSESAAAAWSESIEFASSATTGIIMDLNHRPALGSLEKLWGLVSPHLKSLKVLVLALSCIRGVATNLGVSESDIPAPGTPNDDPSYVTLLTRIHAATAGPAIACCFKTRDAHGVQRRWSVLVDGSGVHTTYDTPVYHKPKDECGGGSAWATGIIDALTRSDCGVTPDASPISLHAGTQSVASLLRRADVLAALCQEEPGDHSTVTRELLESALSAYDGRAAHIQLDGEGRLVVVQPDGSGPARLTEAESSAQVETTMEKIKEATVLAIIRAKNPAVALERCFELVELGCKALEVTVDSADFVNIVRTLRAEVGDRCLIGAGTVCSLEDVEKCAQAGALFALSPIHPDDSFVRACHSRGILAVPAAYTPQEIYRCVEAGAKAVKLFPAQMWSPATLKAVKGVGMFGAVNIMPSGGIDPSNVSAWLKAGAVAVGMGSCLTGGDIKIPPESTEELAVQRAKWDSSGRAAAAALFKRLDDGTIHD